MKTKHFTVLMYSVCIGVPTCFSQERPNILWLTFEDTSASNFGCYGNSSVSTPIVDSLAAEGIMYKNAWAVAPQSSPARSSLITGTYATTYGMDLHRVQQITPEGIFFPQILRDAGYYCTNNKKTDYNSTVDNKGCWDECGRLAGYNSLEREYGQPFFAVFNCTASHMGRIRTFHTHGRRDYSSEGIYMEKLELPSYLPDLPEIRSDYAAHLESTQDIDKWVGTFLEDLKKKNLDEDTIIFLFSDHGGCLPRGKGYLYESGLNVPLIVYFPEKWRHLASCSDGVNADLVNFTDLAPTVLSLVGIKPPSYMHGKALHGEYADKNEREYQFAFATNQQHHFMPVRAVTDGRFKLIRSYIPYRQFALRNYYQWGMPSNLAWDEYVLSGKCDNKDFCLPFETHSAEMLFDLETDPGEINDLSRNPEYSDILVELRKELSEHIRKNKDLGFFLPDTRPIYGSSEFVGKKELALQRLYGLVEAAGLGKTDYIGIFKSAICDDCPDIRFWGIVGYAVLAREGFLRECPHVLVERLRDTNSYVAAEAAYAMCYMSLPEKAIEFLLKPCGKAESKVRYSILESLSLDVRMRPYMIKYQKVLEEYAGNIPEDLGSSVALMAQGVLINLGLKETDSLYGPQSYKRGLQLNKRRREIIPVPYQSLD